MAWIQRGRWGCRKDRFFMSIIYREKNNQTFIKKIISLELIDLSTNVWPAGVVSVAYLS